MARPFLTVETIKRRLDERIPDPHADLKMLRDELLDFLVEQRQALKEPILDPQTGGRDLCQAHTAIFDAFVQKVYEIAVAHTGCIPELAIFAVGSYGRRELCLFSDIDIAYTSRVDLQEGGHEETLRFIRIFYEFMDSLERIRGLRFSFVYRPLCDIERWNYQDLAALIDARFLVGDASILEELRRLLQEQPNEIPLILNLLTVKDELYAKEETLYLNQPNIKLGKGGLRNIQLALWMLAVGPFIPLPEITRQLADPQLERALDFMLKVRNVLHWLSGKPNERLSYNPLEGDHIQAQVASALGFEGDSWERVHAFMRQYYRHAKYLHFMAELIIDDLLDSGIAIGDRLTVKQGRICCVEGTPANLTPADFFLILEHFQQYGFEIDAEIARYLATHGERLLDDDAQERFLRLFRLDGEISRTLTRMHRLGLLERFVPGFENLMMTRSNRATDPYTVGRHTLEAIAHLDRIKQTAPSLLAAPFGEPLATEQEMLHQVYQEIAEPELLYLALLFHDIEKPAPQHELRGAEKARAFAARVGLTDHQTEEICFLIRHHLTMIELARYYQVTEAKLQEFLDKVESLERLRMLYLLTYCDAKANGPANWTDVDRDNLQRLFEIARRQLEEPEPAIPMSMVDVEAFLQDMPVTYRLYRTPEEIYTHVRMVRQVEESEDPNAVVLHFVDKPGFTELHFCGPDRMGLLQGLTGIFYAHHLDLREATIYTMKSAQIAVDICKLIHPGGRSRNRTDPLDVQTKREVAASIRAWFRGELTLEQLFERKGISVSAPIEVDSVVVERSSEPERVEVIVRAADRIGLVHRLTRVLTELDLNIETSKCSVLGGVATNRFYVSYDGDPDVLRDKLVSRLSLRRSEETPGGSDPTATSCMK